MPSVMQSNESGLRHFDDEDDKEEIKCDIIQLQSDKSSAKKHILSSSIYSSRY